MRDFGDFSGFFPPAYERMDRTGSQRRGRSLRGVEAGVPFRVSFAAKCPPPSLLGSVVQSPSACQLWEINLGRVGETNPSCARSKGETRWDRVALGGMDRWSTCASAVLGGRLSPRAHDGFVSPSRLEGQGGAFCSRLGRSGGKARRISECWAGVAVGNGGVNLSARARGKFESGMRRSLGTRGRG
jgi:hypothetical protein